MKYSSDRFPRFFLIAICVGTSAGTVSSVRSAPEPTAGTVKGTVVYHSKVPKARFPDDLGIQRPLLSVDSKTAGLQFAVVYLEPVEEDVNSPSRRNGKKNRFPAEETGDDEANPPEEPLVMDQRDMTFVPHLIAVREGQSVEFMNSDAANHNVRAVALDRRNQFNVLTPVDGSYARTFRADPKQRPIRLGCEIHGWMRAWIYVFDHPRFAVTDAKGRYTIGQVPPGKYLLKLRQPDGGLQADREITVSAEQPTTVDFRFGEKDLKIR